MVEPVVLATAHVCLCFFRNVLITVAVAVAVVTAAIVTATVVAAALTHEDAVIVALEMESMISVVVITVVAVIVTHVNVAHVVPLPINSLIDFDRKVLMNEALLQIYVEKQSKKCNGGRFAEKKYICGYFSLFPLLNAHVLQTESE